MPDWFPATRDVVLFVLAVYGALLSTFNWRQAVRRDRRSVAVTISTALPTFDNGSIGDCFAKIEAVNTGHRVVTISTLTLELDRGRRMFTMQGDSFPGMPDTRLPATLADGESAHLFIAYRQIGEALLRDGARQGGKVTPVCQDTVGNVYRGKPWNVNPSEFSRM
jgi:hypothetical protein